MRYTPLWTFRKWLKECGWIEAAPWLWERQGLRLCLRANAQVQRQLHSLRMGWREFRWERFAMSNRHESVDIGEIALQTLHQVNLEHMRRMMWSPGCRLVALGATVSPTWFQTLRVFDDRCLWCSELGTWRHLCWECRACPFVDSRPPVPGCRLLRRFGWGPRRQLNVVLPWLAQIQECVWRARWRS